MERKWWTLVLVSVATFMLLLDVTSDSGIFALIRGNPERWGSARSSPA
jgi:hypothetical protein